MCVACVLFVYVCVFLVSQVSHLTPQVWDFATCVQKQVITLELPVSRILLHRDNMLLAAVLDDLSIGP